jgi:hypothetical protein
MIEDLRENFSGRTWFKVDVLGEDGSNGQWYEIHRLLCGEIDEAALLPISAGEFRELI